MMKNTGGVLHGEWETEELENGEVRRRCPAVVWGAITSDVDDREANTKKGTTHYLQFRIRLQRHQFVRCSVYTDNPFFYLVMRLKKGDFVFCAGRLTAWSYTTKDNQSKISIDVYPQFILTQETISRLTDLELDSDPMLGDDGGEPDEDGEYSWNPF